MSNDEGQVPVVVGTTAAAVRTRLAEIRARLDEADAGLRDHAPVALSSRYSFLIVNPAAQLFLTSARDDIEFLLGLIELYRLALGAISDLTWIDRPVDVRLAEIQRVCQEDLTREGLPVLRV